jgi:hypothetical protein
MTLIANMLGDVDDAALEQELRELAYPLGCECFVQHLDNGHWVAAFKQFGNPADIAPRGAILKSAGADDRRSALEALRALALEG